jgi:hypothetical protein
MGAACSQSPFSSHKARRQTLPGIRSAVACIESNSCHTCREGQRRRPIKQPILRSLPKRPVRFFAPANDVAYTCWLVRAKEESSGWNWQCADGLPQLRLWDPIAEIVEQMKAIEPTTVQGFQAKARMLLFRYWEGGDDRDDEEPIAIEIVKGLASLQLAA